MKRSHRHPDTHPRRGRVKAFLLGPYTPLPLLATLLALTLIQAALHRVLSTGDHPVLPTPYDRMIRRAARTHMPPGWDWRILKAMVRQESAFRPDARSAVGAVGLAQIMPATATELGVDPRQLTQPRINLDTAARYLRRLWNRWEGVPDEPPRWERSRLAIAAYNAGPGRMQRAARRAGRRRWHTVAPHAPDETQTHIRRVFEHYLPACRRLHHAHAPGVQPRRPAFGPTPSP